MLIHIYEHNICQYFTWRHLRLFLHQVILTVPYKYTAQGAQPCLECFRLFPYAESAIGSLRLNFAGNFFARRKCACVVIWQKLTQENGENEGGWGQKRFVFFKVYPRHFDKFHNFVIYNGDFRKHRPRV